MADYQTQVFGSGGGYTAKHKGMDEGFMTPNFEIMEGMRFGQYYPAPYLPIVRSEKYFEDYIVISAGKAVALDSLGWLVPAGYRLHLAAGDGNGPQYTQLDIDMGIRNALGDVPTVGQYVCDIMTDASISVGYIAGAASYNVYLLSGRGLDADPSNPATFHFHNYQRQNGVAILTDYLLEFPVEPTRRLEAETTVTVGAAPANPYLFDLASDAVISSSLKVWVNNEQLAPGGFTMNNDAGTGGVDQLSVPDVVEGDIIKATYLYDTGVFDAPFAGLATWIGAAKHGDKVTCNADSNWVAYSASQVGDTSLADESASIEAAIDATLNIVGQVTKVDTNYPKQFLDRVMSAYDPRLSGKVLDGETGKEVLLQRHPGTATDGMPHNIVFAGGDAGTGTVRFNLNVT